MTGRSIEFPSPYGVTFILTHLIQVLVDNYLYTFPSPYGVIFILTKYQFKFKVFSGVALFPSPYGVIFILTINS